MHAREIMTSAVVSVTKTTTVQEVASLLISRRISAVLVLDSDRHLLGIISEGDLVRRPETGGKRPISWWLSLIARPETISQRYTEAFGTLAGDVMTTNVICVDENASLSEIARILEQNRIKRVPVLHDGKVTGIVSRADLLHGLIGLKAVSQTTVDDHLLRRAISEEFKKAAVPAEYISIVVVDGNVELWGMVQHEIEIVAARIAASQVPGVVLVTSHLTVMSMEILMTGAL